MQNQTVYKNVFDAVRAPDEQGPSPSALVFVLSTGCVDRDEDRVNPDGWKLDSFRKTGVMLWAHDASLPPIAAPRDTWIEKGQLLSRAEFTPPDMPHPLGDGFGHTVYRMYREGFLRGVSVGFKPTKWVPAKDRDRGMDFEEQELFEFSAVPIPSNPEALLDAGRKGLDLLPYINWTEYALDGRELRQVERAEVERVRKCLVGVSVPVVGTVEHHQAVADSAAVDPLQKKISDLESALERTMQMVDLLTKQLNAQRAQVVPKAQEKHELPTKQLGLCDVLKSDSGKSLLRRLVTEAVDKSVARLTGKLE